MPRYYRQVPASQAAEHTVPANISGPWRLHTIGSGGHRPRALPVVGRVPGYGTWAGCVGRDCTLFAGAALRLNSSLVQGAGTGAQAGKISSLNRIGSLGAVPGRDVQCMASLRCAAQQRD